jgi:hypothetical protein
VILGSLRVIRGLERLIFASPPGNPWIRTSDLRITTR